VRVAAVYCLSHGAHEYRMLTRRFAGTTSRCGSTAGTRERVASYLQSVVYLDEKALLFGFSVFGTDTHYLSHRQTPHYYPRTFILLVCVVIYIAVARWLVGTLIGGSTCIYSGLSRRVGVSCKERK
jgi:hypothetical protein